MAGIGLFGPGHCGNLRGLFCGVPRRFHERMESGFSPPGTGVPRAGVRIQPAPKAQLFDLSRHVLFGHEAMNWMKLGYVYAFAAGVLLAGHVFFGVLRRSFAEVI